MRTLRGVLVVSIILAGLVAVPGGPAGGHGLHVAGGTFTVEGSAGGSGTSEGYDCRMAVDGQFGPYDLGDNSRARGCVDVHKVTTGAQVPTVPVIGGEVTISGTITRCGSGEITDDPGDCTTWEPLAGYQLDVRFLNAVNDPGDLEDDQSDPSDEGDIPDGNWPFCHFQTSHVVGEEEVEAGTGDKLGEITTRSDGSFGPVEIQMPNRPLKPDEVYGQSELCLNGASTPYTDENGVEANTSYSQSISVLVVPGL